MKLQRYRLHIPLLEARLHYRTTLRRGTDLELAVLQLARDEERLSLSRLQNLLPLPGGAIALMVADLMRWRCLTQLPGTAAPEYGLTKLGQEIAAGIATFPEVEVDSAFFQIFAEPLSGLVAHEADVEFVAANDLDSDEFVELGLRRMSTSDLFPADYARALERQKRLDATEGAHHPGCRYEFEDVEFRAWKGRYLRVDVYEGEGVRYCRGLPSPWRELEGAVLELLDRHRSDLVPQVLDIAEAHRDAPATREAPMELVSLADAEFWAGNQCHLDGLRKALQAAKTHVLIASAFLGDTKGCGFKEDLEAALARGVDVTLLWGGYTEIGISAEARRFDSKGWKKLGLSSTGRLRCLLAPSKSHAKYLVWDEMRPTGSRTCMVVGSCNWLSNRVGNEDFALANVSMLLTDPRLLGRLAQHVDILARMASTPDWQEFGMAWRLFTRMPSPPDSRCHAQTAPGRWLFDTDNIFAMAELTETASRRLAIVSAHTGIARDHRLYPLRNRPEGVDPAIVIHDPEFPAPIAERCVVKAKRYMHAKLVLADDTIIVSSCNFLAADSRLRSADGQEIGLIVQSAALADRLEVLVAQWDRTVV